MCEEETVSVAVLGKRLDVNQFIRRATCSEEKHWRHLLFLSGDSPTDDRLQSRWVTSTGLLHLHSGYCARVFSVLIRLCCVASVWMNSSSPQGHQSWVHPLSCSALCRPPCTPWELHFISVSLPEPFCLSLTQKHICIQEQECSWWVFEKGGRQTEKLKNSVI